MAENSKEWQDRHEEAIASFKVAGMSRARTILVKVTEQMQQTKVNPEQHHLSAVHARYPALLLRITEVEVQEPDSSTCKHIRRALIKDDMANAVDATTKLAARMMNIPPSFTKTIKLRDLAKDVLEILNFFSDDFLRNWGATSGRT